MTTPRKTHGITKNTMQNFLIDAGAVYLNYGTPNEKILGGTRGGNSFVVEQEIKIIEIDGAKGALRNGRRVIESSAKISCNLLEFTTQNLMLALAGSDATTTNNLGATGTTHDQIRRTRELGDMDYITNVALVGRISGTNENFIGILFNALADEGLEVSSEDKEESVLEVTFTAHFDPENMNVEPWAIRNPKRTLI
jgi:hypothetical protein